MRKKIMVLLALLFAAYLFPVVPAMAEAASHPSPAALIERIEANNDYGLAFRSQERFQEAAAVFEKSLATISDLEAAGALSAAEMMEMKVLLSFWSATCYRLDSRPDEALRLYRQVIDGKGAIEVNLDALLGLSELSLACGDVRKALQNLVAIEEKSLSSPEIARALEQGELKGGTSFYIANVMRKAHLMRLKILIREGRFDEACRIASLPCYRFFHKELMKLSGIEPSAAAELICGMGAFDRRKALYFTWWLLELNDEYDYLILLLQGRIAAGLGSDARPFYLGAESAVELSPLDRLRQWLSTVSGELAPEALPLEVTVTEAPERDIRHALSRGNLKARRILAVRLARIDALLSPDHAAEAGTLIEESEKLCKTLPLCPELYIDSLRVAQSERCLLLKDARKARELSMEVCERGGPYDFLLARAALVLGETSMGLRKWKEAGGNYDASLERISFPAFQGTVSLKERSLLLERAGQGLAGAALRDNDSQGAFIASERVKNGHLMEWWRSFSLFPESSFQSSPELNRSLCRLYGIEKALERHWEWPLPASAGDIEALAAAKKSEEGRLAALSAGMAGAYHYFVSGKPVTIPELEGLIDEETVILSYMAVTGPGGSEGSLVLFVVARDLFCSYELETKGGDVAAKVAVLSSRVAGHSHLWSGVATDLYSRLIDPARQHLEGKRHLLIIAHGALSALPFSLLCDRRGTRLGDRFTISSLPSATLLAPLSLRRIYGSYDSLFLCDPTDAFRDGLRGLFAVKESPRGGKSFRELADVASRSSIVHLSVPARVSSLSPLDSSLCFPSYLATLEELAACPLLSTLAVLDRGKVVTGGAYGGSEMGALYGSFLSGGTPLLLFSFWELPDRARRDFMLAFYRELAALRNPHEALRRARQETRKSLPLPFFSESFVLYGY
ncbi:MAG: CHAT domain-containing protein [Candidatus Eremiobacteraeota bacterium]|nr:CHAT domain-containing protein [Candidatus Eremiobacteraeota bacterium]